MPHCAVLKHCTVLNNPFIIAMSVISQGLTQPPEQNHSVDSASQPTKREREAEGGYLCECACVAGGGGGGAASVCLLSLSTFKQPCACFCPLLFVKSVLVVKGAFTDF